MQPNWQPLGDDQAGKGDRVRRASHVLLHQPHAAGGLDIKPTAIEADALADDCDARVVRLSPFELNEARRASRGRSGADSCNKRIEFGELISARHPRLRARIGRELTYFLLKFDRAELGRRRVDKVTNERGRFGEPYASLDVRGACRNERARPPIRL